MLKKDDLAADGDLQTSLRYLSRSQGPVASLGLHIARGLRFMGKDEEFDPTTLKTKLVFVFMQFLYTIVAMLPVKVGKPGWRGGPGSIWMTVVTCVDLVRLPRPAVL